MSQVISQGFRTMYEILEVGTIKPGKSGQMENGAKYKANLKFRASNVIQREDAVVGLQEVDVTVEYRILCDSEEESIKVAEVVRNYRNSKTPFYISGDLPKKGKDADVFKVDSFDNGAEFIKNSLSASQPKQTPKA